MPRVTARIESKNVEPEKAAQSGILSAIFYSWTVPRLRPISTVVDTAVKLDSDVWKTLWILVQLAPTEFS